MTQPNISKREGLYDSDFEHDNCGIGFLANIKGNRSHDIVKKALDILVNLEHRGGQGDEPNTGDGAGMLLQLPHRFFKKQERDLDFVIPDEGYYGVGMVFLPRGTKKREECKKAMNKIITEEGQSVLGWRKVPVDDSMLGKAARQAEPAIYQVFIQRSEEISVQEVFERKLYVIRKRAEKEAGAALEEGDSFYFASLSSRTIVYKGMLTTEQVPQFYQDVNDSDFETAVAMVHSRFSTNTFPSWERAHPNRYLIHNGEINTIKGNVNWMHAREAVFRSELFQDDVEKVHPVIDHHGSDSSMFDNTFEFLTLAGRSMPHTAMMMIPEPWQNDPLMNEEKKAFYQFHSCLMEPWDGPTAIAYTDGQKVGACLDRNGLRPARYYVTKDDHILMSSEVGVLDIDPEDVLYKERLHPGHMLLVDMQEGRIVPDEEIKHSIAAEKPYKEWVNEHMADLEDVMESSDVYNTDFGKLPYKQLAFGYTYEELEKMVKPMAVDGVDPVGSMGYDSPLAVLSKKPQLLYNYFKQLFAQVTNPPIDAIREELVTAVGTTIGREGNLLHPEPESARQLFLKTPLLNNEDFAKLRANKKQGFQSVTLPIVFDASKGEKGLKPALDQLFQSADEAVENGAAIIILSDRNVDHDYAPIPALLAVAGLHHHFIRNGTRTRVSLAVESAEPREVHHFAVLLGYGAEAVNPYLVFDSIDGMIRDRLIEGTSYVEAVQKYLKAATKGLMKVLSKMGISTIQSYRGAQTFEAVGIHENVVDQYFTWTPSRIGGVTLEAIAKEVLLRHTRAYTNREGQDATLDAGDDLQWRRNGEPHQYNPHTIHMLQHAARKKDYDLYKKYAKAINEQEKEQTSLRGLLDFATDKATPVSIDEVEPAEEIFKRFRTGAMSFGSISKEAHEALAIAMNRIGGRSNTGEGGEDPDRFKRDVNGDLRRSSIKQVASGRFGVTSHYLVNADEIQIKIAQGAKPGEGGQLPGNKVYPWVAEVRGTTAGVGLISPPPHHDIYSIEDLAELIHDLKNANPSARVSVKLVSGTGVGTIAAGVAKGRADGLVISGYDGGTGAAARTSIKHAGLPWEIGLAETHQTLVLNNLRDRITVETDGKLMTGRDVVMAALLGAEEYAFSTAPLVVLGCVIMRVCHLDTCPVGIATQNPELRKKFMGTPDHVVNFMYFIAEEMREIMASLGFKTVDEMIGRTDLLRQKDAVDNWKANMVDVTNLLHRPRRLDQSKHFARFEQDHMLESSLDYTTLLKAAKRAITHKEAVFGEFAIKNTDRVVGTIVGSEVTKHHGQEGLSDDTIRFTFRGSAGQSFGAFIPKGMTQTLIGDANDYLGKGLSGGKIVAYPPEHSTFAPEESILIGNTTFYGATSGEAYIRGVAGERFCVRNSGAQVVVEGVGDHGCEYMTGGVVVNLGSTGKNFAAGMSGGIAYVLDRDGNFSDCCNRDMVLLEAVEDPKDIKQLKTLIENHVYYTESSLAESILQQWKASVSKFVKVIPKDYKQMIESIEQAKAQGLSEQEAVMTAFNETKTSKARVGGK
ncbi:glutamate synthase (NADH) large subunit [Alteribacillus persepolensis]|uniref:Glutamate synthase (NADH) large subunit n=1 Tax=Alteribacillus persepolensis TaxID=568899 RepID=A0A1G7Z9W6_9BACI|nr:glutamate synthase large subunit [Alteribacillus persepolensis]SDH05541.1 glutamate synthase (NADH) large subunit [Alteribacillus persepolensis]